MNERVPTFFAGAFTALAIVAGLWLAQRLVPSDPAATSPQTPTPTAVPVASITPSRTPALAPKGFRLAGIAVNDDQLYAVIEAPDGSHGLYRRDEEIAGLGRLTQIGEERAVIATESGDLTLWVAPAATATPTITRPPTMTPRRTPRPTRAGDASARGSTP